VTQRDWKIAYAISCGRREGLRELEQSIAAALENVRGIRAIDHEHAIAEREHATETLRRGIGRGQPLDLLPAGCGQILNYDMAVAAPRNTDERDIVADGDPFTEADIHEVAPRRVWNDVLIKEFCDLRVFRQVAQCSWCVRQARQNCDKRDHTSPYGHRAHVLSPCASCGGGTSGMCVRHAAFLSYRSFEARQACCASLR